jgi:hypothetical protein
MLRSSGLSLAALTIALLAPLAAGWAQTEPAACTWETAEPVSVRALERSQTAFRGRCVRVLGETDGWALSASRRRGVAGEEIFIGAYVDDDALRSSLRERPRRTEVLGVVGHCSDICAEENEAMRRELDAAHAEGREPENLVICMAAGFCHYYEDAYVQIQDVR